MMKLEQRVRVAVATGDDLDVRTFSVRERMDELFRVEVTAVSRNHAIALDEVIGNDARFWFELVGSTRPLHGIVIEMRQVRVDEAGLATYRLVIAPTAWRMTQRKNFRIFQFSSELDIVKKLFSEWSIEHEARIARSHKPRKYRVQYDESDFSFACRMLQDAGISFYFESSDGGTKLVLDDEPQTRELAYPLLAFFDKPQVTDRHFVTNVTVRQRAKPGTMTIGDLDYRRPSTSQPRLTTRRGLPVESVLEQFDYEPGAFLFQGGGGGSTPAADDRGASRTDEGSGGDRTETRLLARRRGEKVVKLESSVLALAPGVLFSVANHPHRAVALSAGLLVTGTELAGEYSAAWRIEVEAVSSAIPYRPERTAPKPRVPGLESATVVGPTAEEIHTDEYGRVRVHFHWDRESGRNEASSCWLPTSQPWAGTSFGGVNLPRIGQEVLVEFLGGDPDRPVVIGRVYTETNPPPDKLPMFKHVSGIMSESTPRMVMGAADASGTESPTSLLGGGQTMSQSELTGEVNNKSGQYQATSPTGSMDRWSGSGIKFSDADGKQMIYIQAQRDLNINVNECWRTIVKHNRNCKVGTDDVLDVGHRHVIAIKGNQDIEVVGNQTLDVTRRRAEEVRGELDLEIGKDFECTSITDAINYQSKETLSIEATNKILIVSKGSTIEMTTDKIVIKSSDKLFVQPGSGGFPKSR
jgi:type VI secretion system secreted protein VgrG